MSFRTPEIQTGFRTALVGAALRGQFGCNSGRECLFVRGRVNILDSHLFCLH